MRPWEQNLLVTPDGRVVDPLLKSTLVVRVTLGAAPEAHLLAEVVSALPADPALTAGNTNLESNSITQLEASHLGSNGNNFTRRLMAQGEWVAGAEIAIGKLLVV